MTCTGESRDNVTIFTPPPPPPPPHPPSLSCKLSTLCKLSKINGLLVEPISEFCSMVINAPLINRNILHKCVSSGGHHQSKSGAAHLGCTGNSITHKTCQQITIRTALFLTWPQALLLCGKYIVLIQMCDLSTIFCSITIN